MSYKKKNLLNFIFYCFTVTSITLFFIFLLTIKNECLKNQSEIEQLNRQYTSNLNIVKELQSNKDYLSSETHLKEILSNSMHTVAPETLLISIRR